MSLRISLLALLFLAGCRTPDAATQSTAQSPSPARSEARAPTQAKEQGPIQLTLVGTNDIHGWVHPHPSASGIPEGGVATFAGYLSILRKKNPGGVVLLDAGDLFQGTLASNLTEGAVVIDAYNALGYHAAAIGNHEFDYGPAGPKPLAKDPGDDPFGALRARLEQARFPLLAVNIYEASTGQRPGWLGNDGTRLLEVKGLKVGIAGLVTPTTPTVTNPLNVTSLRFGSLVPEALAAARRLRQRGAQVVIIVAHAGGKCASHADPRDVSTCDLSTGEIFEMIDGLPTGLVDAVVAGHTHAPLGHFVKDLPVIESNGLGRSFATIDLFVDPSSGKVLPEKTQIRSAISICAQVDKATGSCDPRVVKDAPVTPVPAMFMGELVVPDPAVEKVVAPALARVEAEQQRKLGVQVTKHLGRDYDHESALGSFLADSLREMEKADVALLNSGGLRADLRAGELTYGTIYEVLPFDNGIATLQISGEELRRLLTAAYGARKGVFQISGVKVKLSQCVGSDRLREITFADGRPVVPEKKYRLVLPDFLARGGDGLGAVLSTLAPSRIDYGLDRPLNLRDALVAYWQAKKGALGTPKLGRIAFLDDGASCSARVEGHGP
jgi:5'-nucleotidase